MKPPYRIVTNGHEFKIEEFGTSFFNRKPRWKDYETSGVTGARWTEHFRTLEEAQKELTGLENHWYRYSGEWKEVQ